MGVFSRVVKTTIPVGAVAATAYAYKDEIAASSFRRLNSFVSDASSSSPSTVDKFDEIFPRGRWDSNWDFRDSASLVNLEKFLKSTNEEREKLLNEATPTHSRTIVLISSAQYNQEKNPTKETDRTRPLTELGREQAVLVGKRLAALTARKIDAVHMSSITRATETANLILGQLPAEIQRSSDLTLDEGAPYPPVPAHSKWKPYDYEVYSDAARIESAFRKYIHRAVPNQKKNTVEVIVCDGNVIRYFVCRALQLPPESWLRMTVADTSITVLRIGPDGRVTMRSMGDVGHLPSEMITI